MARELLPPVEVLDDDHDDDLDAAPAAPKAMWGWAIAVAALTAMIRQLLAGSLDLSAHCLGSVIGWMIGPLLVAWFVSQFWKVRYAPVVAVVVLAACSLSLLSADRRTFDEVHQAYIADLGGSLDQWRDDVGTWLDAGVGSWRRLGGRDALTRHIQASGVIHDRTTSLAKELDQGARFGELFEQLRQSASGSDAAWREMRAAPRLVRGREQLALVRQLIEAQLLLVSEVMQIDGRYLVVGNGELTPSADVEAHHRDRIRDGTVKVRELLSRVRAMMALR